jgi:4-hydroxy-tetrahydrodipicolinate reductase
MEKIRVVQWGLGNMGKGILNMLLEKEGVEIVGAIGRTTGVGEDLGDYLGLGRKLSIVIDNDSRRVLETSKPDVVILANNSFVKGVIDDIAQIVSYRANVITIAEEMAYPYYAEPELSKEIDEMAKRYGVSVIGTGVNPGFVLDNFIIGLTYGVRTVKSIKASRVNDLSPFGKMVMREQGVGLSKEDFEKGVKDGSVYGHVGFLQSIPMIAEALGLEFDEIVQTREPIISKVRRETKDVVVMPGMVAGCNHIGYAMKDGKAVITLEHPQQIHPELEGIETGDYITIYGDPDIHLAIRPETPGGIGTIAAAVNVIPQILNAKPGLVTMKDVPVAHAIMDDFRNHVLVEKEEKTMQLTR